jgi:hypothetical protein
MSAGRSGDRPCRHASVSRVDSRMCSRERNGSTSTPASVRRLVADADARSASSSGSFITDAGGAWKVRSTERGRAARLPGVYTVNWAEARRRATRAPSCPHASRPSRQRVASRSANDATLSPCTRASSGFTQAEKSSARR